MLCAEPKEHKRFRPSTRPGGIGFPAGRIGDRGDREIVYVPNVYVPFPAPSKFSTESEFATEVAQRYGEGSEVLVSLGETGRKRY